MELKAFDGKRIYIHEWCEAEEPKGVVQIVHGMAEHAGRYEAFARFLNRNGYVVVADDHRGHGKTDYDSLGFAKGNMYEDTLRDEGMITDYYSRKYAGLSYFLFGFSYGSFLAQSYLAAYGDKLDGAVIAGSNHKKDFEVRLGSLLAGFECLMGYPQKPAKYIEKRSFGEYAKQFQNGEWLSTNSESNRLYREDPLCGFPCSYRFYRDFFKGLKKLYTKQYLKKLRRDLPLLIVSGQDDAVGEMGEGAKRLAFFYREKAGMQDVRFVLFEHSRHEFLNEFEDRDRKWNVPLSFFNRICAEKE